MDIMKKFKEIRAKCRERDKLIDELEKSLALKEIWPDVFDKGPLTSMKLEGALSEPSKIRLVIISASGASMSGPLEKFPTVLWNGLINAVAPADALGFRNYFKKLKAKKEKEETIPLSSPGGDE